jgi:DNA polymerase III delta subunit
MFLTDDQLALDAERLATLTERLDEERREIASIAARLQARFPADRVLAEAIEQFIQTTLNGPAISRAA